MHIFGLSMSVQQHLTALPPASLLHLPAAEDASSMSDVSNISNFSTASNKTFVTEESSLVLETLEEGRHHHYLIPLQVSMVGPLQVCWSCGGNYGRELLFWPSCTVTSGFNLS